MLGLSPFEQEALALSIQVASNAVLWSLPPGIAVAYILARLHFPGHAVLNAIVHLPLVLPPVVIGYLLLIGLGRNSPVGGFLEDTLGIRFAFTAAGATIACAVVAFPLLVRAVRLSIEAIDTRYEAAARTLGASDWRVFTSVTLPLMAPGILAGATLAFARAVSEFGATITFAANIPGQTQTLPLALYTTLQSPGGEAAAMRLCLLSVGIAVLSLGLSEWLARRMQVNGDALR
ncbi:MAG: molybdate ABC transporter permease subunit [Pseudomonadota bacterium]